MPENLPPIPYKQRFRKRARHAGGFILVVTGIPLVLTPLPVAPAIFLGLNLLRDDYPWAARLLGRIDATYRHLRARLPHGRLKLSQTALRRQLFSRQGFFWKRRPSGPVNDGAPLSAGAKPSVDAPAQPAAATGPEAGGTKTNGP